MRLLPSGVFALTPNGMALDRRGRFGATWMIPQRQAPREDIRNMNQGQDPSPIYGEVQQFRQVWIWVIVTALTGLVWIAAVRQLLLHRPIGGIPMPVIPLVIFWFIFGIALPALFFFGRLVIRVRDDGIYICFFPFHRTCRPIREYGGWGIRYGRTGKAYSVSGDRGVQIELSNGSRLFIGSQRAEELWRAIQVEYGAQEGETA